MPTLPGFLWQPQGLLSVAPPAPHKPSSQQCTCSVAYLFLVSSFHSPSAQDRKLAGVS